MERICSRGFDFPANGLLFPTGHITLSQPFLKNRTYEVLLVKLAVGKSYPLGSKKYAKSKLRIPYGFDSIYIYNEEEDNTVEQFKHDYILFDNEQVMRQLEQ
jgi:hypothetical protein